MKNIFRIKYAVEVVIAAVCIGVCACIFNKYGINVPENMDNPMLIMELVGGVCTVLAMVDMYLYEHASRWEE